MSSTPEKRRGKGRGPGSGTSHVRTRTPRPDELTRESFEFIAAIDDYKRRHMRSFLSDEQVLEVLHDLGWRRGGVDADAERGDFVRARERYRKRNGRLFPTWSEIFEVLLDMGYRREDA